MTEEEFWLSTPAEVNRRIQSANRVSKREAREKAAADYALANLIGISIGRLYSSSAHMPSIAEAYPTLFEAEELQEKQDDASAINFMKFADSFNKRFKREA